MSTIKDSILQSLKRAFLTFQTFPVVLASALGFTLVTLVRIWMDWPAQEPYNFLFNCLHLSLAMGAIFGLAAIAFVQERYNSRRTFLYANLAGAAAGLLAFVLLYFFGGAEPRISDSIVLRVSGLAAARITAAMVVSMIAFVYFAGKPRAISDFDRSLFMTQKAFLIAAIYGGVLMAGTSGVAGAIQALLYRNMSEKVYMVLGALIGFGAFAIFVGYFPDLRKGQSDPHREVAQKQPKFIEVLFEYITVPIILVLTVVLLSWAGKTVLTGDWPSFSRLSGIVTAYAIGGIWLHMMTARRTSAITDLYRKAYPLALLVILVFGAWALGLRLSESGMKEGEYYFIFLLIGSVAAGLLILVRWKEAYAKIAAIVSILALATVMPVIGYHALPARLQISRLEGLLVQAGILVDEQLAPAAMEPDEEARVAITDAVQFLAYQEHAELPAWFDQDLNNRTVFQSKMGFEQQWAISKVGGPDPAADRLGMYLNMPSMSIDISDYDWAVYLKGYYEGPVLVETVKGRNGTYRVEWNPGEDNEFPGIRIWLDDDLILQEDMKAFMDATAEAVRSRPGAYEAKSFEEMSQILQTPEISLLLVFDHMNIYVDPQEDVIDYHLNLNVIYLKEK